MQSPPPHTDEIVLRMQNGDAEAFRALTNAFRTRVLAYCARMLGDADEAEDATQETFLLAFRDAASLRTPAQFRGWLFGIARHRVLMALRARRNGRAERLDEDIVEEETPFSLAQRADIREHVARAVAALSPAYREVIDLRDFQHLSYAEIAIATDTTESAVKSRIHKARKALVALLAPAFAEEESDGL